MAVNKGRLTSKQSLRGGEADEAIQGPVRTGPWIASLRSQ